MTRPLVGKISVAYTQRTGGCEATAGLSTMSDYLRALDPIARARYTKKLQLVGLSEDKDPYELWKCDNSTTT